MPYAETLSPARRERHVTTEDRAATLIAVAWIALVALIMSLQIGLDEYAASIVTQPAAYATRDVAGGFAVAQRGAAIAGHLGRRSAHDIDPLSF